MADCSHGFWAYGQAKNHDREGARGTATYL